MKFCSKCNTERSLKDFYKDRRTKDGLYSICKYCMQAYRKNYKYTDEQLKKRRKQKADSKKRNKEYYRDYSKKPEEKIKEKCRHKTYLAIKNKFIERNGCLICNKEAQAHHEDYNKPLKVIWLCEEHHLELHQNRKIKINIKWEEK